MDVFSSTPKHAYRLERGCSEKDMMKIPNKMMTAMRIYQAEGGKGITGVLFSKLAEGLMICARQCENTAKNLRSIHYEYECPVCEEKISEWDRFHRKITKETYRIERACLCPRCRSFERTRDIWLYFMKNKLLQRHTSFLHFAPEHGLERRLRSKISRDNYITTDLYRENVDVKSDITSLLFEDERFGLIYCSNVLEHVKDDKKAMQELYRVLAYGGLAIIQVPLKGDTTLEDENIITPEERDKYYGQSDHVRMYGRDIVKRLEKCGFSVREVQMPQELNISDILLKKYNIEKEERIFFCRKLSPEQKEPTHA